MDLLEHSNINIHTSALSCSYFKCSVCSYGDFLEGVTPRSQSESCALSRLWKRDPIYFLFHSIPAADSFSVCFTEVKVYTLAFSSSHGGAGAVLTSGWQSHSNTCRKRNCHEQMSSSTSGHHPSRADEGSLAPPGRFSGPLPPFLLRHSARPWRPPTRAPRTAHAPPPPRRRRRPSGPLGGALPSPSPPPSRGRAEASEPLPDQNPPPRRAARLVEAAGRRRGGQSAWRRTPVLFRGGGGGAGLGGAQDVDQEFPSERRGLDLPRQEVSVGGGGGGVRPPWGPGQYSPAGQHQLWAAPGEPRPPGLGGRPPSVPPSFPPSFPPELPCRVSQLLVPTAQRVRHRPPPPPRLGHGLRNFVF